MPNRLVLLVVVVVVTACAHPVQRRDWSEYQGPGAEQFQAEELPLPVVKDPIEPMNRTIAAANHGLIIGVVDPLAQVYVFLTPSWFRAGGQNFGANLAYPRRFVTNLLQAKWRGARDETYRFAINTTIGLAGILDPARWWGIEPSDEDFGQTFSKWGWRNSTYVMLPVLGPSTTRDTLGLPPDMALNLAMYSGIPFLSTALAFNDGADKTDEYKQFTRTNYDPYHIGRLAWTLAREERSTDFEYTPEATGQVQTLQSLFLDLKDPSYRGKLKTARVSIPKTGTKLPYSYRMQKEPAPMLFVIPGTGSHRLDGSPLAISEMAWDRGFSVAILSNSMNFEFMKLGASVALPGHAPADARDTHVALDAIFRELDGKFPGRIQARALTGYSLGAFHAFYIAAAEADPENSLIDFDRYLTLDSPVNLVHGMGKLDGFYNAPLTYPPEEREAEVRNILHKAIHFAEHGLAMEGSEEEGVTGSKDVEEDIARLELMEAGTADMTPAGPLPFSNLEAEFLIGLSFRLTLGNVIYASQEREDLGVLKTERGWFRRTSAYEEIADYSFVEYMYAFMIPYFRDKLGVSVSAEDLLDQNDLRSIADKLRSNGKIRHFANRNDFLTSDEDVTWITELLGESNVRFYAEGGPLGNLYRPEVQEEVMSAITDLLETRPSDAMSEPEVAPIDFSNPATLTDGYAGDN